MPTIPQDYLAVVSILIAVLSHKVRAANLSDGANSLIATPAIIIIAVVTVWMSTGFTTDLRADILLVCSMVASLAPGLKELYDLLGYQYQSPSPLGNGKQEDDPPA